MNYIFLDLEFNQNTIVANKNHLTIDKNTISNYDNSLDKHNKENQNNKNNNCNIDSNYNKDNKSITPTNLTFEIIQIGALKVNEKFEIIQEFNELIKPTVYKKVNPYVEKLTKITNELLDECDEFLEIYNKFIDFIGNEDSILCVWGKSDIKEFIRNIKFFNLPISLFPLKYIDVQKHASKVFKLPKGVNIGLKVAIEQLNINFEENFHNAFYDAFYTCEVFKKIYNNSIKPELYKVNNNKKLNKPQGKVNVDALLNQFSKMYSRELSEDEKSMIQQAYNMGRTRQFIK